MMKQDTGERLRLAHQAIDILCPLHVKMDGEGMIIHAGPAMKKLRDYSLVGKPFWHVFELIRPKHITSVDQAVALNGRRISLRFRDEPRTPFKGVVALGPNALIANLSFGIGLVEAVREYGLTNDDFAGTDLAIEMLFLSEAKTAAMHESLRLNECLVEARDQAEYQANTDALTGLANRRAMTQILAGMVMRREDFACMHLDLDYFKRVNDTYGHAAGDHILVEVSQILRSETRKDDCVARVGGDEFVLLFKGLTNRDTLDGIANRIIQKLEVPVNYEGHICQISGSAGTTLSTSYDSPDPDLMLSDADTALYASKNAGRGQHLFYSKDLPRLAS